MNHSIIFRTAQELAIKIPNIIGGIDNISKSRTLWDKMQVVAVFIFLGGGIYFLLQSWWHQIRGIDEKELHKSIYDMNATRKPTGSDGGNTTNSAAVKEEQTERKETDPEVEDGNEPQQEDRGEKGKGNTKRRNTQRSGEGEQRGSRGSRGRRNTDRRGVGGDNGE